ncbi:MAG: hypothetical protein WCI17_11315 [bacterium]
MLLLRSGCRGVAPAAENVQLMKAIQEQPLTCCPDYPERVARWEAWWTFASDRPLACVSVGTNKNIRWDKAFDLLEQPEQWLAVRRAQLENTHWAGDEVPSIRVDIGPVAIAAFAGAPLHFSAAENTSWQHPIIRSWDPLPPLRLDPDNRWYRAVMKLLEVTAADAAGNYAVMMPDYSGAVDALANLRGSEDLLLDLYDHRAAVIRAADALVDVWEGAYRRTNEILAASGAAMTTWVGPGSRVPYTVPTCDFNYMIGPQDFIETCLPSLREQARRAGRCALHVDGPGAANHAEAIASAPEITAVQYTPGAATPSALERIHLFKRWQAAGKPVVVCCPKEEVPEIVRQLDPRGLLIWPSGVSSPSEADEMAKYIQTHGRR